VVALQQRLPGGRPDPGRPAPRRGALSALAARAVCCSVSAALRTDPGRRVAAFPLALAPASSTWCHFATPERGRIAATSLTSLATRHLAGGAPALALGWPGPAASTKYTGSALVVPALAPLGCGGEAPATRRPGRLALGRGPRPRRRLGPRRPARRLSRRQPPTSRPRLSTRSARRLRPRPRGARGIGLGGAMLGLLRSGLRRTAGLPPSSSAARSWWPGLAAAAAFVATTPAPSSSPSLPERISLQRPDPPTSTRVSSARPRRGGLPRARGRRAHRPVLVAGRAGTRGRSGAPPGGGPGTLVVALAAHSPPTPRRLVRPTRDALLAPPSPPRPGWRRLALAAIPAARARRLLTAAVVGRAGARGRPRRCASSSSTRAPRRALVGGETCPGGRRGPHHETTRGRARACPRAARTPRRTLSREMAPPERFDEAARR